jgi:transposase
MHQLEGQWESWFRAGRPIAELARQFEASANAIRKWVKQSALDEGLRSDGLRSTERESLAGCGARTRCCGKSARYPSKAAAWFATETGACRRGVPIRECEPGHVQDRHHVPGSWPSPPAATMRGASGRHRRWRVLTRGTHFTHHRDPSFARNLWVRSAIASITCKRQNLI